MLATKQVSTAQSAVVILYLYFILHVMDQTMALGSTQPVVKMSTRNVPGGKGGRCVRLTTYHHTVPLS